MDISTLKANQGKQINITTKDYGTYARYPVKTHVVVSGDSLEKIMDDYVRPYLEKGDMIFISEKIVAISQGRAWTMQLAIQDVGAPKILFAALCSAVTKPFGVRGVFYKIVGTKARAIDGPCDYTLPPYNHYAKLAPLDPDGVAKQLAKYTGCGVAVMDANDIGGEVLGTSGGEVTVEKCKQIFDDNPLGQASEQTPIAIVRKVSE